MRAAVVVLGDIGRSPRMQYHARALGGQEIDVDLIGYVDSEIPAFLRHPRLAIHPVGRARSERGGAVRGRGGYLLRAGLRGVSLLVQLTRLLLWRVPSPDVILVQTPPAVPALAVAVLAARARRSRLIVDWHNLTSAMLALRLGRRHPAVRMVDLYERTLARRADAHLFVSATMAASLGERWGIRGTVFADRPAERFVALDAAERQRERQRLLSRIGIERDEAGCLLLISPTSWTADEDMAVLEEAAIRSDALLAEQSPQALQPVILVTGLGPLRERFEERIRAASLRRVHVRTLWLASEEYARALACADLGLSLHRSASGLDLPMKVLDLFGAGVPVAALDYGPCLRELVRDGDNGRLFGTGADLAALMVEACLSPDALRGLKDGVARAARLRWGEAWRQEVLPLLA